MGNLRFGFHPVREMLRHRPQDVAEVRSSAQDGKRRREIEGLCGSRGISLRFVSAAELDALAGGGTHNGFCALLEVATGVPSGSTGATRDPDLLLLLEDVQDPRNLGAILRVAEGAGVGRVMIRDRGSAPISPAAVKTSAGAAEWIDVERIVNPSQTIERLRADGFWIYGAAAEGEAPWSLDLTGKVVLCLGGEENGLRRRTRESCDALVGLPMRGRVDSLNVATAAAALLYDAVRQRLL
ncbi:MAG: 23S rRNA (guanosine(2251)-2'-O)-methyltransferase RlmB [Acidobacteriota bacterium]